MPPLQLLFLGTGTSTALPSTPCLTGATYPASFENIIPLPSSPSPLPGQYNPTGKWPSNVPCTCCRGSQDRDVPEGWKNRRGNTSVVLRKKVDGRYRNVVIDVGKSFRSQTIQYFPRWGVQTIDAVILTHGHADAYFGLDDLREFCVRQGTTIPIYLDQATYESVAKSFPYLVDASQASGGGDLPSLKFHLIDHDAEFEVETIKIRALPLEHGIYFKAPAGANGEETPNLKPAPLICLGYMIEDSIAYLSDVSNVPDKTWDKLLSRPSASSGSASEGATKPKALSSTSLREKLAPATRMNPHTPDNLSRAGSPGLPSTPLHSRLDHLSLGPPPPPLPILIVDALWPVRTHISHVNFPQALDIALRLRPEMTYLVGMTHPLSHFIWEELGRSIRGEDGQRTHPESGLAKAVIRKVWSDRQFEGERGRRYTDWSGRVAPAWDGLAVEVGGEAGWREVKEDSVEGWIC